MVNVRSCQSEQGGPKSHIGTVDECGRYKPVAFVYSPVTVAKKYV